MLPAINLAPGVPGLWGTAVERLRNGQSLPQHFTDQDSGRVFVFDNLIFDILGMALVALCLAVMLVAVAAPAGALHSRLLGSQAAAKLLRTLWTSCEKRPHAAVDRSVHSRPKHGGQAVEKQGLNR